MCSEYEQTKFFHHFLEYISFELQCEQLGLCKECVLSISIEQYVILTNERSFWENSICRYIDHLSAEIDKDFSRLFSFLKDDVSLVKPDRSELFKIVQIETIRSILQEANRVNCLSV